MPPLRASTGRIGPPGRPQNRGYSRCKQTASTSMAAWVHFINSALTVASTGRTGPPGRRPRRAASRLGRRKRVRRPAQAHPNTHTHTPHAHARTHARARARTHTHTHTHTQTYTPFHSDAEEAVQSHRAPIRGDVGEEGGPVAYSRLCPPESSRAAPPPPPPSTTTNYPPEEAEEESAGSGGQRRVRGKGRHRAGPRRAHPPILTYAHALAAYAGLEGPCFIVVAAK